MFCCRVAVICVLNVTVDMVALVSRQCWVWPCKLNFASLQLCIGFMAVKIMHPLLRWPQPGYTRVLVHNHKDQVDLVASVSIMIINVGEFKPLWYAHMSWSVFSKVARST